MGVLIKINKIFRIFKILFTVQKVIKIKVRSLI